MFNHQFISRGVPAVLLGLLALPARAQSFRVQCPTSTITHPVPDNNNAEPAYIGPTQFTCSVTNGCGGSAGNLGYLIPQSNVNGAIKCQQVGGGDGYATMADGTQTYMFSFGPLSGLADIAAGQPGTEFPNVFNTTYPGYNANPPVPLLPGDPATTAGASDDSSGYNLGTTPPATPGTWTVTAINVSNAIFSADQAFQFQANATGLPDVNASSTATVASAPGITGHVDPRQIIDVGVMNGNIPAPLMAFDEDDEFFLTLTNVGMIMRPDLFEQHTIHFHGYPNASSFYDGVPDASVAINIGASFTYYYLAPDAGTYFWHCHITPPEHLQMGMVGQLYVRPRQNRVAAGGNLYTYLGYQNGISEPTTNATVDLRTACTPAADILCSATMPAINTGTLQGLDKLGNPQKYVYNDGD